METMTFKLKSETKDGKTQTVVTYAKNGKEVTVTLDPEQKNELELAAAILAEFDGGDKKELKAGDRVVIKDAGKRYRTLTAWATTYLKSNDLVAYGAGIPQTVENGTKGTVVQIGNKYVLGDKKVAAVQIVKADCTFIILIDPEGIEAA